MRFLVLAAGHATRLRPLTDNCAKPLLPVRGRALLDHLLDRFHGSSIRDVAVVTNGKFAHDFERWAKTANEHPFRIQILDDGTVSESDRLGAIGDIQFAIERLDIDDDLIVAAGDNLFTESLTGFVEKASGDILVGVHDIGDLSRVRLFGQVVTDHRGRIVSLLEKPTVPSSTLISVGLYYFPRKVLPRIERYLRDNPNRDQPGRLIHWLIQRVPCYAYPITGNWLDIGSKESYEAAQVLNLGSA